MHDLKDKLNNNIEAKKDDIKSFTQNKIEQFATRINNKLKDASKSIDERFLKEKANDSKEKKKITLITHLLEKS
jgi:F0F1-type ATP synthase membrane subunit b/b'